MMLPAVTAPAVEAAIAPNESADAGGDPGAFAAAIAQFREASLGAVPAAEPPPLESAESATEEAVLTTEASPAIPIDAIDWLLGQCTAPGAEPVPMAAVDGTVPPGLAWSTPGATLVQMVGLRAASVRSDFNSGGIAAVADSAPAPVVASLSSLMAAEPSMPGPADSRQTAEALLVDTLLSDRGPGSSARDAEVSLDTGQSVSPTVESAPSSQAARVEASSKSATAALHTPVGTRAWNDELASKLTWLIDRGEQLASIRVTPDSLGPIDIRIAVREGEASIWFGASQADTRQAIEQAIPRLREMLASQGLSLADAGVFQQAPHDPQRALLRNDLRRASRESGEATPVQSSMVPRRPGLIDDYA